MSNTTIQDMTKGNPVSLLLKFTIPLLLGNVFQQLYNMADSLIVGKYIGPNALASVGTCGSMHFLFFSLSSGLAIGVGIIVAQYFGAKNDSKIQETIANSIYVLVSMSVLVSAIGFFIAPFLLKLLNTPPKIIGDSVIYLRTTCMGIIFISLYNGVASIWRALGDSKTPLYFLIFSSICNVIMDLLFVIVFHLGVFGVGLATVICQAISAIAGIVYAYKKIDYFHLKKNQLKPDCKLILHTFRLGVPIALQNAMIAISMMVLQGVVNSFGETVMAAYTIVNRIEQLVHQPYGSLSTAITNYSGQNIGAGNIERVKKGYRSSIKIALIFSIALIPVAYLFGSSIVGFFVKDPVADATVIAIGTRALQINSVCYFALGMIYIPRAVLNGCGDTGFAMINGFTEVICRIGYSQLLTRIPFLGYWGIWVTTGVTWATTAVICVFRYLSGVWKEKVVS